MGQKSKKKEKGLHERHRKLVSTLSSIKRLFSGQRFAKFA